MNTENLTGPQLFELGQHYLRRAREAYNESPEGASYSQDAKGRADYSEDWDNNQTYIQSTSALSLACFAGAQAAALASVGSDANDPALGAEWSRAVGDWTDAEREAAQASKPATVDQLPTA
jgi:hypothetical protein